LNFSNFINRYRVNHSKQFFQADFLSRYTISSIGFESGFNSRSTFYNAFKKFTGMSPSDYIHRQERREEPALCPPPG
jgi:AraC-like DNA-binding protein